MLYILLIIICVNASSIDSFQQNEISSLRESVKILSDQLEKWSSLFLNSLEPKIASTTTFLANIDNTVKNLQERAHIWDTFQLHVTAWNEQLATLDRKMSIISKGQERIMALEAKFDIILKLQERNDKLSEKVDAVLNSIKNLDFEKNLKENVLDEFAIRGILGTIKNIEKKIDKLVVNPQSSQHSKLFGKKTKLAIKCSTPRFVEDLLSDISSKVDIIFDKIEKDSDYINDKQTSDEHDLKKRNLKKRETAAFEEISTKNFFDQIKNLQNITQLILFNDKQTLEENQKLYKYYNSLDYNLGLILDDYALVSKKKLDSNKNCLNELPDGIISTEKGCEVLHPHDTSGVYIFENIASFKNPKNRTFNKRLCLIREDFSWTVIQKRENHHQNFNLSWFDYKNGFGNLHQNFWFGNDFISKLSNEEELILRVELEDFKGNLAWAEYKKFQVLSELNNYQLIIRGYRGNASDSLSSHNTSFFSTFDKKNDNAPLCCPCAVSYGSGWWFNSCFESNLNGPYFNENARNGYFGGIIWEHWLGNYSLKKTLMMIRDIKKQRYTSSTSWPYYEDP